MQPVAIFVVCGGNRQPASLARDSDSEKIDRQNQHYGWYSNWSKANLYVNDFTTVLQKRQGLLIVPSPTGGGLGWGRFSDAGKIADTDDFTLTPTLSLKGEGELKDPAKTLIDSG